MRWRTKAGDELEARLGEPMTKDFVAQAWRTALDPKGEWIPAVLAAADRRLTEVRRHVAGRRRARHRLQPDPGEGVCRHPPLSSPARPRRSCSPTTSARAGASRTSARATSGGWSPCAWCPRASTCRASPSASTRRRPRRRSSSPRRSAASSGPAGAVRPRRSSCPRCRSSSTTPRDSRRSATTRSTASPTPTRSGQLWAEEQGLLDEANRADKASGGARRGRLRGARVRRPLRPRALRQAAVRHARPVGSRGRGGLPRPARACSSPTRCPPCSTSGRAGRSRRRRRARRGVRLPVAAHRALAAQRKELNKLVSTYARKKGLPHANIHLDLRRACGGPDLAAAIDRAGARSASRGSGAGSSAAADRSRSARLLAPFGPSVGLGSALRLGGEPRTWTRDCSDRAPSRRRTT